MKNFTKKVLLSIILLTACFSLKAQTNVSGGIYSNTTWTKVNSPYIVTDTVVVFPGVTLTVDPGVTVKFNDHQYLEIRQAALIAIGTNIDSITFTSSSNTPTPGIWNEINLNQGHMRSYFSFCNFMYATTGLIVNQDTIPMRINNSKFDYNIYGLRGSASFTFDTCNFMNNSSASCGANAINNCIYMYNNNACGDYSDQINGTVQNCVIDSNNVGIYVGNGYVENCIIKYNQTGITGGQYSATIGNCIIDSNYIVGVLASNEIYDSIFNCEVKFNGVGIEDGLTYNSAIYTNVIEDNNIGILEQWGENGHHIYCNKICNNSLYDFKYNWSTNFNISNNYWCSTDSATIASHILDGYDSIPLGLITFMPIDTVGCYLTGCNLHLSSTVINATCDTCHNGQATINVTYGHPTYTYTWYTSPIQYTQTAKGLASGTYSVCVSDGNGCTACTTVFVDSSNCTGFTVVANGANATCLLCNDGKAWVDVINGTAPYSYTWYTIPIQNTDTAYNLLHGSYSVCVTDLYGCAACDSVTIGTGACSAHFDLYPDTSILHTYIAVNMASGAGTLTYDWDWGDGGVHDNTPFPSHTYANAGFYKICLTIADTAGCTDTYCNSFYLLRTTNTMIQVNVIPPVNTGVKENSDNASFAVSPNPASHNLTLIMPDNASKGTVKIFNLLGEITYLSAITKQKTDLDISNLSNGIYIIEAAYGDAIMRQKFIKE